jgi:hypothetical protein
MRWRRIVRRENRKRVRSSGRHLRSGCSEESELLETGTVTKIQFQRPKTSRVGPGFKSHKPNTPVKLHYSSPSEGASSKSKLLMKFLLTAPVWFFSSMFAWGDFVIETRHESKGFTGTSSIKTKGDKVRMHMPDPQGNATAFIDLKSGETALFVDQGAFAITYNAADFHDAPPQSSRNNSGNSLKLEPLISTGQREKIGDWMCEIYASTQGGITRKRWVTKDIPNYNHILAQLKAAVVSLPGFDIEDFAFQGGVTVKTVTSDSEGTKTLSLLQMTEESVPDSEFEQPEGYTKIRAPKPVNPSAPK